MGWKKEGQKERGSKGVVKARDLTFGSPHSLSLQFSHPTSPLLLALMTPPTLTSWSHKRRSVFKTFSPGTEESPQERPCPLSGSPSQDTAPQLAGMWGGG